MEKVFKESVANLRKMVVKKVKDNNNIKSNYIEPHHRLCTIPNVHRWWFAKLYGGHFYKNEFDRGTSTKTNSPLFTLYTLERLLQFVSTETVLKIFPAGDAAIICPLVKINAPVTVLFCSESSKTFEEGQLALCLKETETMFYVFFMCNGLEEDDSIPEWVESVNISEVIGTVTPGLYNEEKGRGIIDLDPKMRDCSFVDAEQEVEDGDILRIRGSYYEVLGVGIDPALNPRGKKCIRFTRDFPKKEMKCKYWVIKPPKLYGKLAWVSKSVFDVYRRLQMQLKKMDENNFGVLEVKFQNSVFNKLGFLVHDSHV